MAGDRPAKHHRHPSKYATSENANRPDPEVGSQKTTGRPADEATITHIKRVLCQKPTKTGSLTDSPASDIVSKPLEELLPPLTSSNDVDVQLYAIIAVILNQFVQNWYNRITPDGDFVAEIVRIIAHCTRGLESRLRHVDLESLLLDELPALIDAHLHAVQVARRASHNHYELHLEDATGFIFHTLRPHNALSPSSINGVTSHAETNNEIAWAQLIVDGLMPLVLPPEDLSNPCLKVLVSEIFSQMIVYNAILGKTSEPWLLWEGVTKVIYALRPNVQPTGDGPPSVPVNRLQQFGLVSSTTGTENPNVRRTPRGTLDVLTLTFWSTLQQATVVWTLLRSFVTSLMQASSNPPRPIRENIARMSTKRPTAADDPEARLQSLDTHRRPIAAMRIWTFLGRVPSLQGRMPWLTGLLALLQWLSLYGPGHVCGVNSAFDRLLSVQVYERLLDPVLLPPVLQAIRRAVFPDNALAPPRVPPTSEEVVEIKRECARAIVEAIPDVGRRYYFATEDKELMMKDVDETLTLFGDQYINKHLIVAILELFVVRLFPELAEESAAF